MGKKLLSVIKKCSCKWGDKPVILTHGRLKQEDLTLEARLPCLSNKQDKT